MPPTTIQELQFFHAMRYFEFHFKSKILDANGRASSASPIGLMGENVLKAWGILVRKHLDVSFSDTVMSYMLSDGLHKWLLVFMSREDGYAPMDQSRSADNAKSPTGEDHHACTIVFGRSHVDACALRGLD